MMGLMVLGAIAVYLSISVFITYKTASWAKANNKKPWLWGGVAVFLMYNLVFWDLIPTLVIHKYYCDTQAGFWVYKTPEQWKKENPSEFESMQRKYQERAIEYLSKWKLQHPDSSTEVIEDMLKKHTVSYADSEFIGRIGNSTTIYHLNDRFDWIVKVYPVSSWLPIYATTKDIVDINTKKKLFTLADFWYKYFDQNSFSHLKTWMKGKSCDYKYSEIELQTVDNFSKINLGTSK